MLLNASKNFLSGLIKPSNTFSLQGKDSGFIKFLFLRPLFYGSVMSSSEYDETSAPYDPEGARSAKKSKRQIGIDRLARMNAAKRFNATTSAPHATSLPDALAPSVALSAVSTADLMAEIASLKSQNAFLLSQKSCLQSANTSLTAEKSVWV